MNKKPNLKQFMGLVRSLLIYYAIPGRARAWRVFYKQFIKPGNLCFDIGAHVGNRSAAMLALGARVVAVEPQELFAKTLRRMFAGQEGLTVLQKGLGDKIGRQTMLVSSQNPTVSTLSEDWVKEIKGSVGFSRIDWDRRFEVDVTTLDNLIAEFGLPAFCKIDAEGAELEILKGLSKSIAALSFEYLPAVIDKAVACLDRLSSLGKYEFNLVESEFPRFAFSEWVTQSKVTQYLRTMRTDQRAGEVYARLTG